jgi:hypothetical protein
MAGTGRGGAAVTAGAPDLALVNLSVDRGQAASVPREPCHRIALVAQVIELEDYCVALATVDARASCEHRADVREVTGDRTGRIRATRVVGIDASPARSLPRTSAMAVGAHDLAPSDLGVDGLERRTVGDQRADVCGLVSHVVELQHDRVALAAIDARVRAEVLQDVRLERTGAGALRGFGLIAMEVAARAEIGGEARPAVPLVAVAEPVEQLQGEIVAAAAAPTEPTRTPDEERADG